MENIPGIENPPVTDYADQNRWLTGREHTMADTSAHAPAGSGDALTVATASRLASISAPLTGKARIQSIDTLRGVALFGILLMNIVAFANPFAAYLDPRVDGAGAGIDLATFMAVDILAEGSMRAIFSMLFGAGMLIFLNKPNADPDAVKLLYYRRALLLVAFGLFNAYILVWPGDILYTYGMTGLVLYFFRNQPATRLAGIAAAVLVLLALVHSGMHWQARMLNNEVTALQALPEGTELTAEQTATMEAWETFLEQQFMTPALIAEEQAIKQSGYWDNFVHAAQSNVFIQTFAFVVNTFWDALAMMLLGMAFLKWGVFDASRSMRFYTLLCLLGFAVGIPLNAWETITYVNSGYQLHWSSFNRPTYDLGRLSLALGYIGLVMMICKSGVLGFLRHGLARVGQMALTNYLSQSVICNLVFLGFGLGLAGELQRHQIYYIVLAIWIAQFWFSIWWLASTQSQLIGVSGLDQRTMRLVCRPA